MLSLNEKNSLIALALTWSSAIFVAVKCAKDTEFKVENPFADDDAKTKYDIFKTLQKAFSKNFSSPWISSNTDDIKFYHYGRPKNKNLRKELSIEDTESFTDSTFSPEKRLILLIHGFESSADSKPTQELKNALLESKDISDENNIVVVGWGKLATTSKQEFRFFTFPIAAANAELVARKTVEFIKAAMSANVLKKLDRVHFIGFGIGSQIAGFAAKLLATDPDISKNQTKIARLTGLDPAGPFYTLTGSPDLAVNKKFAKFVDVYHTDQGRLGISIPVGHIDFYPNGGGPFQPGCNESDFQGPESVSLSKPTKKDAKEDSKKEEKEEEKDGGGEGVPGIFSGQCAHIKAVEFFYMSVTDRMYKGCDCPFIGDEKCMTECSKSVEFGYHVPTSSKGRYLVIIPRNQTQIFKQFEQEKEADPE